MLLIRHSFVMEMTPVAVPWRCVVRATPPGSTTAQTASWHRHPGRVWRQATTVLVEALPPLGLWP